MKKLQFSQKSRRIGSKGFYIALAISLLAIGGAAWLGITAAMQKLEVKEPEISSPTPVEQEEEITFPPETDVNAEPSDVETEAPEENEPTNTEPEEPTLLKGYAMPLSGTVLTAFSGDEVIKSKTLGDWMMHTGTDLAAPLDTPVKAVASGKVTEVKTDDMWGNTVTITHENGVESYYANLNDAVRVTVGQTVKLGDVIGTVGESAEIEGAEETHLHFGIKQDGEWVDPVSFIEQQAAEK